MDWDDELNKHTGMTSGVGGLSKEQSQALQELEAFVKKKLVDISEQVFNDRGVAVNKNTMFMFIANHLMLTTSFATGLQMSTQNALMETYVDMRINDAKGNTDTKDNSDTGSKTTTGDSDKDKKSA